LSLRDEFKREFYVPVTRIAPTDNNVFKHSANADDALSRAFSAAGSAYLDPVESTRQAFQDIAAHHLALVAGMQAAVRSLLDRFSPLALEEHIGKAGVLDGVLPQFRKAQMWEQFEKEYAKLKEQAEEDFQQVFGQYFERAYTEEIHRLRSAGFGGKTKPETQD
jgi:type VI secretion system FHA domain protein